METIHIDILRYLCLSLEPTDILRMCILNKYWFNEVCTNTWWKMRYQIDREKYRFLPCIEIAIPEVKLFCRLSIKMLDRVASIWNPKNIRYPSTFNLTPEDHQSTNGINLSRIGNTMVHEETGSTVISGIM